MRSALRSSNRMTRALASMLVLLGDASSRRPQPLHDRALYLTRAFAELCRIHGVEVSVSGSLPPGPAVLAANHLSYLDPVLIASQVSCIPLSKAEVSAWPLIGAGARRFGVIFVQRDQWQSRVKALRRAMRALEDGCRILNFPEGTTTDGSALLPFHRGIFGVAQRVGCPIVPTTLSFEDPSMCWAGDAAFAPHYWKTAGKERVRASIHFGPSLAPSTCSTPAELAALTRKLIQDRLARGSKASEGFNRGSIAG